MLGVRRSQRLSKLQQNHPTSSDDFEVTSGQSILLSLLSQPIIPKNVLWDLGDIVDAGSKRTQKKGKTDRSHFSACASRNNAHWDLSQQSKSGKKRGTREKRGRKRRVKSVDVPDNGLPSSEQDAKDVWTALFTNESPATQADALLDITEPTASQTVAFGVIAAGLVTAGADQHNATSDAPGKPKEGLPKGQEKTDPRRRKSCPVCGISTVGLTKHLITQHQEYSKETMNHVCSQCNAIFRGDEGLRNHISQMHPTFAFVPTESDRAAAIDYIKTTGFSKYFCSTCKKTFPSQSLLELHFYKHDGLLEDEAKQMDLACPGCEFSGKNFADLVEHVSTHVLQRKAEVACLICGQYADKLGRGKMKTHMEKSHAEELKFIQEDWHHECDACGEKFLSSSHLKLHASAAHKRCCYCNVFMDKGFTSHTKQHAVNGLYPCTVCEESFPTYRQVGRHCANWHNNDPSRKCLLCGRLCRNAQRLEVHVRTCVNGVKPRRAKVSIRVKGPYTATSLAERLPCDQCGRLLSGTGSLRNHIRTVHGDYKQKLAKVKEEKKRLGLLSKYVPPQNRMKFEEFPYGCSECRMGYMFKIGLLKHNQAKHPEKSKFSEG
ncbi:zinc finger protein 26-like [Paramacrobiotus metropolitanus]|uniref:zinc finger protein 26-like n=1 Tax=Paramacrobiotus metropolitanus TaxID=2943436 RepID=UPI0024464B22|nr:zinc finger protein 26-like [Paramacrobiotus metropolitanus]